ncbi:MAG: hypothetical protein AAF225_14210, partial [Pseudomonadota bacterium]
TVQGSGFAGTAGAVAAGAAILDSDDSGSSSSADTPAAAGDPSDTEAAPTEPETSDDPLDSIDFSDLENTTGEDIVGALRDGSEALREVHEGVSDGTISDVPAFYSAIRAENLSEAIIIVAGVIAVMAALSIFFARVDDWNQHKR